MSRRLKVGPQCPPGVQGVTVLPSRPRLAPRAGSDADCDVDDPFDVADSPEEPDRTGVRRELAGYGHDPGLDLTVRSPGRRLQFGDRRVVLVAEELVGQRRIITINTGPADQVWLVGTGW